MFDRFFRREQITRTDSLIDAVQEGMHEEGIHGEDYAKLLTYLERLHEIKVKERFDPVSRDTMATVVGNLLGILMIVAYEQKHVITSKGLNQILRPRNV